MKVTLDTFDTAETACLPDWISQELVQSTIEVWQPYYPQPLTSDDAIEIIMNVAHLFDVLCEGRSDEELCRVSKSQQP